MKVIIAASHRFHLLDLARELEQLGHDVSFYSYVPTRRAVKYGLKKQNCKSLLWLVFPFLILQKVFKKSRYPVKIKNILLDYYLSVFMPSCDFFIGLGTVYLKSFEKAKKLNAITILEWGSKHIIEQNKAIQKSILDEKEPKYFEKRSIDGYNIADYIAIPAEHVKESFIKQGFANVKLIVNPYGVDLKHFTPTVLDDNSYDLIMVGGWSYTKGGDHIKELMIRHPELSFLHVGPLVDMEFPSLSNMKHIEPVDQQELVKFYKKAKVFILLSRAEGLAMVQIQAVACGLPIICSKDTGGIDLANYIDNKEWIMEVDINNHEEIDIVVKKAFQLANKNTNLRNYVDFDSLQNSLSWNAYGKRYNEKLRQLNGN